MDSPEICTARSTGLPGAFGSPFTCEKSVDHDGTHSGHGWYWTDEDRAPYGGINTNGKTLRKGTPPMRLFGR
jgi:hypothetical protein